MSIVYCVYTSIYISQVRVMFEPLGMKREFWDQNRPGTVDRTSGWTLQTKKYILLVLRIRIRIQFLAGVPLYITIKIMVGKKKSPNFSSHKVEIQTALRYLVTFLCIWQTWQNLAFKSSYKEIARMYVFVKFHEIKFFIYCTFQLMKNFPNRSFTAFKMVV